MKSDLTVILKDSPAAVRHAMIADAHGLEPGAAHVMGRFWTAVRTGNGNLTMPPAAAYRQAAASEATFRCLLRALAVYAPHISTSLAKDVSDDWYARRPKPTKRVAPVPQTPLSAYWPKTWQRMKPGLDAAPIRMSTRRRYLSSIDRCAAVVTEGLASDVHGFIGACEMSEAFVFHPDERKRVKPVTAANYLEGLIALGARGGVAEDSLAAMRFILRDLRDQGALAGKNKHERLATLMERGGYAHVADRIGELRSRAHDLPAHSAARRRFMQQAVVCAVILNKPPRKGDLVTWRIGEQLVREIDGTWRAEWHQEKTGRHTETGVIWREICEILDEWILDGRPNRLVHLRYNEIAGRNWLTLSDNEPYRNLPTELTKAVIGVPSHDLRTLAADYMRRHDPAHAANVIAAHLGHGTAAAGEEYRAECKGATAEAIWQDARVVIAARSARSSGKPDRHGSSKISRSK